MSTVILAEKPSQARSYAAAFAKSQKGEGFIAVSDPLLPADTVITYGFGHLVKMALPDQYDASLKRWSLKKLPIFPDQYIYVVPRDKKKQFGIVTRLLKQADTIVIATDSDREGENIAWSIMREGHIDLQHKRLYRLWINSLEKSAIREGFQNLRPGGDYYFRYKEAQTRQISDWLVGMNASPLFTLLLRGQGAKGVYSIGRVQTPTLYLVYLRDMAIANFKPEDYWLLQAECWSGRKKFIAKLSPDHKFKSPAELEEFLLKNQLGFDKRKGIVSDLKKEKKSISSPRLFSLSSLQTEANRLFHASASQVLNAVQSLYESKFLSYPRTDCNFITPNEYGYLAQNLSRYASLLADPAAFQPQMPLAPDKRYVDSSKVQEHHAIIMTKTTPSAAQRAKLSPLEGKIYDLVLRRTLESFMKPYFYEKTTASIKVNDLLFKASGNVTLDLGWKTLESRVKDSELPPLEQGQELTVKLKEKQEQTKPPAKYTEGTLIAAMKTAGKDLSEEDQVILKDVEGIGTEATRASIIDVLKKRGYLESKQNKLSVTPTGIILCKAAESEPLLVSAEMTAKWEKALKQVGDQERSQDNFLSQIKRFIQKMLAEVPGKMQVDQNLAAQVSEKKAQEASLGTCPVCKTGQISDKGKFYGCSNYKGGCRFTLPKKFAGKTMGKRIVKTLINKGETDKLDGFISKKTGRKYSAKLKLNGDKLELLFD